ncbi:hypothetical protein ACFYQQ_01005 [Streptomyces sp. NPDC005496]|uniref:hypothetical protein n=1 Tax=Streptomyces sp. NPDC005496 TaxID=3364716 RepID=UPI00369E90D3
MNGPLAVADALFVDLGDGREIKEGARAGQITYKRQPRARYECLRCGYHAPPVTGAPAVRDFVTNEPRDHRASCPAITTHQQGAHAA